MSKFKAGDLALIIGTSGNFPSTLGMCVELTEPVELRRGPGWHWKGCPALGTLETYLMPLRGDFQPEQQKAKEEIA